MNELMLFGITFLAIGVRLLKRAALRRAALLEEERQLADLQRQREDLWAEAVR